MSRVVGLLRTEDPVVLRLAEQPPALLRVTDAPVRLGLAQEPSTLLVTDRQGPPGPQGEPGPVSRLGTIRWADTHVDPEDYLAANERQQLKFVPDPAQTQDFLGPPFAGAVSWTDNRIVVRPNSRGDWQNITVNLLVVAGYAGGKITADLDVGTGAPVQTSTYVLSGSGVAERATFPLGVSTLDGVLANGIKVFLTGTVPFVIQSEAIVYKPDLPGIPS